MLLQARLAAPTKTALGQVDLRRQACHMVTFRLGNGIRSVREIYGGMVGHLEICGRVLLWPEIVAHAECLHAVEIDALGRVGVQEALEDDLHLMGRSLPATWTTARRRRTFFTPRGF